MTDAAAGRPDGPPNPEEGWRDGLTRWAWAYLAVLRRHRWILRIPLPGPPTTPNQIAWLEDGLYALRDTGLTEAEKLSVVLLLSGFVRNDASVSADIGEAWRAEGANPEDAMGAYGRALARLTGPERFPALTAVLKAGVFDQADEPDAEFVFGLERVLDGVGALVRARNQD